MRVIGVDTGGTFTDTVVRSDDGPLATGKALSVPQAPELGVLASLDDAAAALGLTRQELLAGTDVFAHGTTVGLNALLTGRGARVGVLTTSGFESTLAIARAAKVHGLTADELTVPSRWSKAELLVPRHLVRGVDERIDAHGTVLRPIDLEQAAGAVRELLDARVEAIAICLLWSVVDSRHELALEQLVRELAPHLHVSVSSRLAPRLGEYERTSTVVLDASVGPLVAGYLQRLDGALRADRFDGRLLVMRMGGGVQPLATAMRMPVTSLHSGPVGGVIAAQRLGTALGERDIVTADVGGTSFDVGLVLGGEVQYASRPMIERHPLAVPVVDVTSIAIGGGSIAWIDDTLGALRVGPHSAGADPGPACYGRGGTAPTLTDAAVVLGYVDRLQFALDRQAARDAVATIAAPLGLSIEEAADGIVEIGCEHMRELVRRTTVQRGFDPADFTLYAFGGAGGQYVGRFLVEAGVRAVVVPALAPAFSAYGAAAGDLRAAAQTDIAPGALPDRLEALDAAFATLALDARARLGDDAATTVRTVSLRFLRQPEAIEVAAPDEPLRPDHVDGMIAAFHRRYEEIVGRDTARVETPVEVIGATVHAVVPSGADAAATPGDGHGKPSRRREIWFAGGRRGVDVYEWSDLAAGQGIDGPVAIESAHTTVIVHPNQQATVDAGLNLRIEVGTR
jgi:N-methylhydantoinase A